MYNVEPDGSATVCNISVSPFVPLQHNNIDISTVNRLSNFGIRFAIERGWCAPRPSEGAGDQSSDDITIFFAGVDAQLIDAAPKFSREMTPASTFFYGQFWVAFVGTSSYGMHGKLYHYDARNEEQKVFFGTFSVTGVCVSMGSRKPVPIPVQRAAILRETMQKHNMTIKLPMVERIDTVAVLQRSGLFTDETCTQICDTLPTCATTAPLKISHRRTFEIRETDIDFNKHVNQMAMIQFIINTFRSAVGDETTIFPRLLDSEIEPLTSDLLLRRLRIDYIQEIPMNHAGVTVTLFFNDQASRDAILASSRESRRNELAELWYIAQGLPRGERAPFVASIGKLLVYC